MALRFRRSIRIAPGIRVNFNKKSASVRIGPKGLGYTISSTGQKRVSAGIPGTGISYSQVVSSKTPRPAYEPAPLLDHEAKPTPKGPIALLVIAVLFGIGWCSNQKPSTSVQGPTSRNVIVEPAPTSINPDQKAAPREPLESTVNVPSIVTPPVTAAPEAPSLVVQTLFTTAGVRLRAEPSTGSRIVLTVPSGSSVQSTGANGQWHSVTYGNYTGWIRGDYLAAEKPSAKIDSQAMPLAAPVKRSRSGEPRRSPRVGSCDCPYDLMRNGRSCGGRSAYSRPGGRSPACYF